MKMAAEEENGHTGTLKLSGSCLQIGRWLAEDAAAVKNGRWDGGFSAKSTTYTHFTERKLYTCISKWNMSRNIRNLQETG